MLAAIALIFVFVVAYLAVGIWFFRFINSEPETGCAVVFFWPLFAAVGIVGAVCLELWDLWKEFMKWKENTNDR